MEKDVKEIKKELKEIEKLSNSEVMAPVTWSVGCQALFSLICC